MFSLGLVVALLFILLLGLTALRALENRPGPNAEMLADMMVPLQEDDNGHAPPRKTPVAPAKAKHAHPA